MRLRLTFNNVFTDITCPLCETMWSTDVVVAWLGDRLICYECKKRDDETLAEIIR